jgi:hypothetical protein
MLGELWGVLASKCFRGVVYCKSWLTWVCNCRVQSGTRGDRDVTMVGRGNKERGKVGVLVVVLVDGGNGCR